MQTISNADFSISNNIRKPCSLGRHLTGLLSHRAENHYSMNVYMGILRTFRRIVHLTIQNAK